MDSSPRTIFEEHCDRGELAFQVGVDGAPVFPPRVGLTQWRISAGRGVVYATTTVRSRGEEPRDVSLIDLDEGFRMMSRVQAPGVQIGRRVEVRFDADSVPYFVPAAPPADAGPDGAVPEPQPAA